MAKISKQGLTVLLVVGIIALMLGLKFYKTQSHPPILKEIAGIKLPQRAKGNPQAPIKIIEFIDFQCPACARGYQMLHDYLAKNPDKIYIELRYFPLSMHKHGFLSAQWGECAARQEKFWPFLDLLISRQDQWSQLADPLPPFRVSAKEVGMDVAKVKACLEDKSVDKVIQADVEEGNMRSVSSTPTYFINHEMVVGTKSLGLKMDELLGIKNQMKTEPKTSLAGEAKP